MVERGPGFIPEEAKKAPKEDKTTQQPAKELPFEERLERRRSKDVRDLAKTTLERKLGGFVQKHTERLEGLVELGRETPKEFIADMEIMVDAEGLLEEVVSEGEMTEDEALEMIVGESRRDVDEKGRAEFISTIGQTSPMLYVLDMPFENFKEGDFKKEWNIGGVAYTRAEQIGQGGQAKVFDLVPKEGEGKTLVVKILDGKEYNASVRATKEVAHHAALRPALDENGEPTSKLAKSVQRAEGRATPVGLDDIPRLHEAGRMYSDQGEETFIVMDKVEGKNLHEEMREQSAKLDKKFTEGKRETKHTQLQRLLDTAVDLERMVKQAAGMHAAGIIHGDIKPANYARSDEDGMVKPFDFGVSSHVSARPTAEVKRELGDDFNVVTRQMTDLHILLNKEGYGSGNEKLSKSAQMEIWNALRDVTEALDGGKYSQAVSVKMFKKLAPDVKALFAKYLPEGGYEGLHAVGGKGTGLPERHHRELYPETEASVVGTIDFMSPEVLAERPEGYGADTFALGVLAMQIARFGDVIKRGSIPQRAMIRANQTTESGLPSDITTINDRLPTDTYRVMSHIDDSPAIQDFLTLVEDMMQSNPKNRPSDQEAYVRINKVMNGLADELQRTPAGDEDYEDLPEGVVSSILEAASAPAKTVRLGGDKTKPMPFSSGERSKSDPRIEKTGTLNPYPSGTDTAPFDIDPDDRPYMGP